MTPKEAIEILESELRRTINTITALPEKSQTEATDLEDLAVAYLTAIEALEKQIEKKPKMWSEKSEWSFVPFELPFGDWGYECPCCGNRDIDYPEHHCECGQAINWSEEE